VTANTTLTSSLYAVNCNAAGAAFTVTLPNAIGATFLPVIAKIDASANAISVQTAGSQTINGQAPPLTIAYQYSAVSFRSDNANWWIN
jgi:hypothetical protein